ncbi:unnamed protein product [Cyprideis torosa]|uniref:Uncharacterized protein n=1 Tax=Cyprideis torosa TaxID=163714 RepID=A0A7R8ZTD9_9CRUS|nr:unnamed protein product [Cyprideis torosa]CAG0898001.1 unnamed protein product [Cyprideis torosa]
MVQARQSIESRLRVSLPEDLPSALTDGVVLCHLANHVRSRAVASIHVPSPAVPKLSVAKCRRNIENFLDACRRIGVPESLLFDPADLLTLLDDESSSVAMATDNSSHSLEEPPTRASLLLHDPYEPTNTVYDEPLGFSPSLLTCTLASLMTFAPDLTKDEYDVFNTILAEADDLALDEEMVVRTQEDEEDFPEGHHHHQLQMDSPLHFDTEEDSSLRDVPDIEVDPDSVSCCKRSSTVRNLVSRFDRMVESQSPTSNTLDDEELRLFSHQNNLDEGCKRVNYEKALSVEVEGSQSDEELPSMSSSLLMEVRLYEEAEAAEAMRESSTTLGPDESSSLPDLPQEDWSDSRFLAFVSALLLAMCCLLPVLPLALGTLGVGLLLSPAGAGAEGGEREKAGEEEGKAGGSLKRKGRRVKRKGRRVRRRKGRRVRREKRRVKKLRREKRRLKRKARTCTVVAKEGTLGRLKNEY